MGSITINGKQVKKWVIDGKTVKTFSRKGKVITLVQPIVGNGAWHYGDGAGGPHPTKNDWIGIFATSEGQTEFEAITNTVGEIKFRNEQNISGISLPQVESIGDYFFADSALVKISVPELRSIGFTTFLISKKILKYLDIRKVNSIPLSPFTNKIIDDASTEVFMNKKYYNDTDRDAIFGNGFDNFNIVHFWDKITFHWFNDDGTPYTGPEIPSIDIGSGGLIPIEPIDPSGSTGTDALQGLIGLFGNK